MSASSNPQFVNIMILIEKMETLSLGKLSMNLKITAIENGFGYDDPNPIIHNFQSVLLPLVCVLTHALQ